MKCCPSATNIRLHAHGKVKTGTGIMGNRRRRVPLAQGAVGEPASRRRRNSQTEPSPSVRFSGGWNWKRRGAGKNRQCRPTQPFGARSRPKPEWDSATAPRGSGDRSPVAVRRTANGRIWAQLSAEQVFLTKETCLRAACKWAQGGVEGADERPTSHRHNRQ